MVKLSDHIFCQPTKMSETSDNILWVFAVSIPTIVCFSMLIMFLLLYVIMAEKNHAIGRQAIKKGVAWTGATLIAFVITILAALDIAMFAAVHAIDRFKASFNERVLDPIILPAIGWATGFYNTACNHIVESLDAAESYSRKLLKDEEKMQQVLGIFCAILIAGFVLSSLYLHLWFSGLLSRDDLRYVFKTYLICLLSLGCLMVATYVALTWVPCGTTLNPAYVLDYLRRTAGVYWPRLIMMTYLDESVRSVPRNSEIDSFLHLGAELPTPEELLNLHLQGQSDFDFNNKNDLVVLFKSLQDYLSLELPSVTIMPPERLAVFKNDVSVRSCRMYVHVMKEQRKLGFFYISYISLRDQNVENVLMDKTPSAL